MIAYNESRWVIAVKYLKIFIFLIIMIFSFFFMAKLDISEVKETVLPKIILTDEDYKRDMIDELGNIPIMMYHGIVNKEGTYQGNYDKDGYTRTLSAFRNDLEMYYQLGYRMIKLDDYIHGRIDTEYGYSPIILTFDDGDDNNGGGSDDGSGSGSGDGIDDGTDSSGGNDNGYTAEELKAAISDKEDDIAQAKEDLHDAQISYKEAKAEVDKATVKAKLAGTVTTAYSKGTLPTDGSAAIVVKAADGMYVKTSISEMELDSVKVGGTIKCVSSDTGDEYTAEVKEISDFPTADSSNGGDASNPNSSYYPIVAFIKDADGLSPGGSVEVSYSSKSMGTANENAVYLQKAYIRTEDKKSYVYLRDKKTKRLKKQYITVGKTMNGQYIEIVSGVTEDDNIAFPYGKNLREGVKTKISEDDSEMIY